MNQTSRDYYRALFGKVIPPWQDAGGRMRHRMRYGDEPEAQKLVGGSVRAGEVARQLRAQCFRRAKLKGLEFDLPRDWFLEGLQRERCAVSGIEFRYEPRFRCGSSRTKQPFMPSVDRIDNALGYVKANCRLVCIAVNLAMNNWGEEVLFEIAAGMTRVVQA